MGGSGTGAPVTSTTTTTQGPTSSSSTTSSSTTSSSSTSTTQGIATLIPDPLDLTNVKDVATYLGVDITKMVSYGGGTISVSDLLQRLITAASYFIQTQLNRTFPITIYFESRNGTGSHVIVCADYPVLSVASVTIDDVVIPPSTNTSTPGYLNDSKSIYLRGYKFWKGIQNVLLSYTAGYMIIPPEIAQTTIDLAARKYKERDRIGYNSKSIQGEVITFSKIDLTDEFKSLLRQYQKVVPI